MSISIRPLADNDLKSAEKILTLAFQRSGDWMADLHMYRKIQPDGYFLAEQEGTAVGMVGAIIYSTYAYIGLMAVHPENQRQGMGAALMQHVLAWLDLQQVSLIILDASPAGQPLYERLGFTVFEPVVILQRKRNQPSGQRPLQAQPLSIRDLDLLTVSDTEAFGADRGRVLRILLNTFPGRAFLLKNENGHIDGYLFAQKTRIGPWVMLNNQSAELLLQAALSLPFDGPVSLAVPGENTGVIAMLQRYGFEQVRVNTHMARGAGMPVGQRPKIFSQASLSLG